MTAITLGSILGYKNPKAFEYNELVEEVCSAIRGNEFMQFIWDLTPPIALEWHHLFKNADGSSKNTPEAQFVRNRLKGQTLVDLGSGSCCMIYTAGECEVQAYVCVDLDSPHSPDITHIEEIGNDTHPEMCGGQFIVCQADMLDFVSNIQTNSVNFAMNGVSVPWVIPSTLAGKKYMNALAEEMYRATRLGGLVLGLDTGLFYLEEAFGRFVHHRVQEKGLERAYVLEKSHEGVV